MTIYLAFYKGKKQENPDTTFFDRLICYVTNSRYSHVELVGEYSSETKIGECWTSSPRDKGVRPASIKFDPIHWELFEYTGPVLLNAPNMSLQDVYTWFEPKRGLKYDWLGAVGTKFKLIRHVSTKYFCSEIVAEFFMLKKPHRFTPKKLFVQLRFHLKKITI
jgi:hypothetical protein